jgi:hypothetical protein
MGRGKVGSFVNEICYVTASNNIVALRIFLSLTVSTVTTEPLKLAVRGWLTAYLQVRYVSSFLNQQSGTGRRSVS